MKNSSNAIITFSKAITKYIKSGFKNVTRDKYKDRLLTCDSCEKRKGLRCGVCGCFITTKAKWKSEECPHPSKNKWNGEE
jgi:hypothetical protein